METRLVNPNDCRFVQSRIVLDPDTVRVYAEMMDSGIAFDPCKGILTDLGAILIYDGNHRGQAAKANGSMLEVELTRGTDHDATWLAAGANTRHGLRRTPGDIAKAVKDALQHPHALGKSDREIARHCGCDHKTVGKYRKELEASGERPQMPTRTVQRNGTQYQMSIPLPPDAEESPEPVRTASPQVFDRHMPSTSTSKDPETPMRRKYTEDIFDCPTCGRERSVCLKSWLVGTYGIARQYDIRCEACGATWTDRHWLLRAKANADKKRLEEVHQRHNLIPEEDLAFDERLHRCEACLEKYFDTDKGITHIYEINRTMATLRGVTYPWPPGSQKYGAMTANFALEDLRKEVTREDWERAKRRDPEPEREQRIVCQFCGAAVLERSIYRGTDTGIFDGRQACICRSCASKALHTLLGPSDPDRIADSIARWNHADTLQTFKCPDCGRKFTGVAVQF